MPLLPPKVHLPVKFIFGFALLSIALAIPYDPYGNMKNSSKSGHSAGFDYGSGGHKGHGHPSSDPLHVKSAEVKGRLLCGKSPIADAILRLYRNNTESRENLLAVVRTGADGHFRVEGNTAHMKADDGDLIPRIRIFHKCDDGEGVQGYRTFAFLVQEPAYVSQGRIARKAFDIGTLNLELEYPEEKRELKYTDDQPLGGLAPI